MRQSYLGSAEFRIRGLDGLRAVAMTLVFLEHKTDFGHKLHLGSLGVWLFFVLSGYLITSILLERRRVIESRRSSAKKEILSFFYRRAFRIFPAYYALLLIASFLSNEAHPFVTAGWAFVYATYTTNLVIEFVTKSWPGLGHFWTLAIEEQFYIIIAPLLLLVPIRKAKYVAWGIAGCCAFGTCSSACSPSQHHSPLHGFAGQFRHNGGRRHPRDHGDRTGQRKGLVGRDPGFGRDGRNDQHDNTPHITFNPTAGALLFWATIIFAALTIWSVVANQDSAAVAFLHWKPIQLLGRISYAFYLWHYLVDFRFAEPALRTPLPSANGDSISFLICLADYAATVAVAAASWVLIERPLLKMRDRLFQQKASTNGLIASEYCEAGQIDESLVAVAGSPTSLRETVRR